MAATKKRKTTQKRKHLIGSSRIIPNIESMNAMERNILNLQIKGKYLHYAIDNPKSTLVTLMAKPEKFFKGYNKDEGDNIWQTMDGDLMTHIGLDPKVRTFGRNGASPIMQGTTAGLLYDCNVNIYWEVHATVRLVEVRNKEDQVAFCHIDSKQEMEDLIAKNDLDHGILELEFTPSEPLPLFVRVYDENGDVNVSLESRRREDDEEVITTIWDFLTDQVAKQVTCGDYEDYEVGSMEFKLIAMGV